MTFPSGGLSKYMSFFVDSPIGRHNGTTKLKRISRRIYIVITLATVLAVLVFAFVLIEVNASRSDLLASKRAEAKTLVEMFAQGGASYMLANDTMEDLLIRHLHAAAILIRHSESHNALNAAAFDRIAKETEISFAAQTDSEGAVLVSSIPFSLPVDQLGESFGELRDGELEWIASPGTISPVDSVAYYLLIAKSSLPGRYIVTGFRSDLLLEYRKQIGIGALLKNLSENRDIQYVVLQDEAGIVTASRNVRSMSPIDADPFLARAFATDSAFTRITDYEGEKSLEAVHVMYGSDSARYLARLGLSLQSVRTIQQRAMQRVILVGAGMLLLGVFVLGFLLTRQRFASLQEEHRRVKTSTDIMLENIADGIVAVDETGAVLFMNSAARRLFPVEADIMNGDILQLRRTLQTGTAIPYIETSLSPVDGGQLSLGISTSVIASPKGAIESVIAIVRDLTEEKRIEEQMRRHERLTALGELAGGVAHEIRNPLNAIGIIAQRLKSEFHPQNDGDEYLSLTSTVRNEVERVNKIIKQFLDFAKPPALHREPSDVSAVIREAAAVIDSQAKNTGVSLHIDSAPGIRSNLDRNAFKQALLNLFQNALDAMPDGGMLTVETALQTNAVSIRIADTGHGMNPETQARMFNLYFSTKHSGTGMGLSIVHQIITEHDGIITVNSAEGKGTEFIVLLPPLNETNRSQ